MGLEKQEVKGHVVAKRVVKEISISDTRLTSADYIRELEAIAKFSHPNVWTSLGSLVALPPPPSSPPGL